MSTPYFKIRPLNYINVLIKISNFETNSYKIDVSEFNQEFNNAINTIFKNNLEIFFPSTQYTKEQIQELLNQTNNMQFIFDIDVDKLDIDTTQDIEITHSEDLTFETNKIDIQSLDYSNVSLIKFDKEIKHNYDSSIDNYCDTLNNQEEGITVNPNIFDISIKGELKKNDT